MFARQAVKAARETTIRQKALSTLGVLLCAEVATFEEGLSYLNQAVALNPSDSTAPKIQLQIAEVLHAHKRTEEALKAYNRYLESYNLPELAVSVRQGKGRLLISMERYDEALAVFLDAATFATTPDKRSSLLLEAADAAAAAKRYPRAIELYRQLIKDGARAGIPLRLARCLEAFGQEDAAIKEYQLVRDDAFSSEQDVQMAVLRLAGIYIKSSRFTNAINEYSAVLQRLKQHELIAQVYLERGRTYYRMDNLSSALTDFKKVEDANSLSSEEARFFLVLCLYRLGDDSQARALAREYVQFYPNSVRLPDVSLWLAKSDFNQGDYVAAQDGFAEFAKRWPTDSRVSNALYLAARSAYQNQNYTATVDFVSQLAQRTPESTLIPDARFLQAEALVEQARHAEARDLLNAIIRRYPNADWIAEAYGLRGDCLVYTAIDDPERYSLALMSYQEAVLRVEEDMDVSLKYLFRIGRVLERQNLRDEAADQYTRLIYRVLNCPEISAIGREWFQKALTRLRMIEAARGNLEAYDQILYRVQRAQIPGLEYPLD
jgi:TolA-binding protein